MRHELSTLFVSNSNSVETYLTTINSNAETLKLNSYMLIRAIKNTENSFFRSPQMPEHFRVFINFTMANSSISELLVPNIKSWLINQCKVAIMYNYESQSCVESNELTANEPIMIDYSSQHIIMSNKITAEMYQLLNDVEQAWFIHLSVLELSVAFFAIANSLQDLDGAAQQMVELCDKIIDIVEPLKIFATLRNLATLDKKSEFRIHIDRHSIFFKCRFSVGFSHVYPSNKLTPDEMQLISIFIGNNKQGVLVEEISSHLIDEQLLLQQRPPSVQEKNAAYNIQKFYKNHVNQQVEHSTTELRNVLMQIGSPVKCAFEQLPTNSIIVVANAEQTPRFGEKPGWDRHSYIAIKSGNGFRKVYELGLYYTGTQNEELCRINDVYRGMGIYIIGIKTDVVISEYRLEKLQHLIKKKRVFVLNNNITEESVEYAFRNECEQVKNTKKRYLGALYNCNHLIFDTLRRLKPISTESF